MCVLDLSESAMSGSSDHRLRTEGGLLQAQNVPIVLQIIDVGQAALVLHIP